MSKVNGALDGGSPFGPLPLPLPYLMSHVKFKKCQCLLSLWDVINYGEGCVGGGGYKMRPKLFAPPPPPRDRVKVFCAPSFKKDPPPPFIQYVKNVKLPLKTFLPPPPSTQLKLVLPTLFTAVTLHASMFCKPPCLPGDQSLSRIQHGGLCVFREL